LQGFYDDDHTPVLNTFLKVSGSFGVASTATVQSPPTILIHFCLQSVEHLNHFSIINLLLEEYYPNGGLQVIDLPFNINSTKNVDDWNSRADETLDRLSYCRHVVAVVTDHSDPDTGDLWLGLNKRKKPSAQEISEVGASLSYYFVLVLTMNIIVDENRFWTIPGYPGGVDDFFIHVRLRGE
jgi:hypothetical protein